MHSESSPVLPIIPLSLLLLLLLIVPTRLTLSIVLLIVDLALSTILELAIAAHLSRLILSITHVIAFLIVVGSPLILVISVVTLIVASTTEVIIAPIVTVLRPEVVDLGSRCIISVWAEILDKRNDIIFIELNARDNNINLFKSFYVSLFKSES